MMYAKRLRHIAIMEQSRRKSTSLRQTELLIQFMEGHIEFALGRVRSKEARAVARRLWEECAEIVNSESEGVYRTPKEWSRAWNDYKCRVRSKLAQINKELKSNEGGTTVPIHYLSPLEDRVASIIGRDVGGLTGVRRDHTMDLEIDFEEMEEQVEVHIGAQSVDEEQNSMYLEHNSPTLDTPIILNHISPTPDTSRTIESQSEINYTNHINQPATAKLPQSVRSRIERRQIRPRARTIQRSIQALDNARVTIARIEARRARTEEMTAAAALKNSEAALKHSEAALKQSEAALKLAEAMTSIAQSMHTIANRKN